MTRFASWRLMLPVLVLVLAACGGTLAPTPAGAPPTDAVRNGDFLLTVGVALTLGEDAARRGIGEAVARLILPRV